MGFGGLIGGVARCSREEELIGGVARRSSKVIQSNIKGYTMIDGFISYIEAEKRYSPLTVRNYRHDIELFAAWCASQRGIAPEEVDLTQVTTADVREWIMYRVKVADKKNKTGQSGVRTPKPKDKECVSAASMNRELSSLRCFYRYLRQHNLIESDIFSRITSLRASRKLPSFVPETRMETLLDTVREKSEADNFLEQRDALIITLFYSCGIRLAELCGIKIGDFAADNLSLRVVGKGEKCRVIPLLEEMRERVQQFVRLLHSRGLNTSAQAKLIVTAQGRPLSRSSIQRIVKRELSGANIPGKRSPHVLRHTFATHLLNRDADMRDIQELMGHASLKTTQCYTHNSIAQLQAAYAKAHPHR